MIHKQTIGFIGQGWIGKNYADDFEARGYTVVRYALETQFIENKPKIKDCQMVFIAVPTPTTPEGFDDSAVRDVLSLVGSGHVAVIKSTLLPGTTKRLQNDFSDIVVLHSPEFLVEKTAAYDAAHPNRNIVGIPIDSDGHRKKAAEVMKLLPSAPFESIMDATDAELVKYAGNCFLYTKVVFMNLLYDLIEASDGDFDAVRKALIHDPRIGESHTLPIHESGRGAGGHCFIKDFEAFRTLYEQCTKDELGAQLLKAFSDKNRKLLVDSGKDLELIRGVFGDTTVG